MAGTRTCFVTGVRLTTVAGDIPVESLREGDLVVTLVGQERVPQPIVWIGRRNLDLPANSTPHDGAPIRIRRHALADGVPCRDVLLSHDHRVFVGGKLIPARLLVNGMTILPESNLDSVHYFHVELERHAVLLAEGLPVESFLDEAGDRSFFSNANGPAALQPTVGTVVRPDAAVLACAPLAMTAAEAEPAWRLITDRARALGFLPPHWDTTSEPDLSLIVDGTHMRPVLQEQNRSVFVLPPATRSLRLASRASIPFDLDRTQEDWRRLGVGVTRIVYRAGAEQIEIPADHPSLIRGWHDAETDGATVWRWTNGDAHLPLPMPIGAAGATIELHLSCRATYAVVNEPAQETRLIA